MALDCKMIREFAELRPLEPAWRDLLGRSSTNQPTLTPQWLGAWWRVFGGQDGRQLRTAVFFEGGRLVGMAPLLSRRHWHRTGIPFRRLELIASGEAEADETCSDYLGVIAERGQEEAVATGLVAALSSQLLGPWDELVLSAMDGEGPTTRLLTGALERAHIPVENEITGECPYISLPPSWEGYLGSLPPGGRYFVTRSLRNFDQWAHGDAELHEVRTPAELDLGKHVLRTLHGDRWRADQGKGGVFSSHLFTAFHDEVMASLLAEGALELLWLTVRGDPVAALYNIVWNGKVHFYQSGRKLDVPKGVRPGIILHAHAIRRAIAAGRREYDFLAGASQYKRQLATAARPLVRLRALGSPRLETARLAADRGLGQAKRLCDRLLAFRAPPHTQSQQDDR
jgi:CelD/BcsL family acetyltransferase involved in cellulose biosynthesis